MNAPHKSAACPFCGGHLSGKQKTGFYVHPNNDCLLSRFEFDDLGLEQFQRRATDYAAIEREHLGDPEKRTGIYEDKVIQTGDRLTDLKANDIIKRDGFKFTGAVLMAEDGRRCIVELSAVRWLSNGEMWALMNPANEVGASSLPN